MKYFIYCRKSSEEDNKQVQSLDTQERILVDFATTKNLQIIDIFREAKSAKDAGTREIFKLMLSRVEKGEADGLLVSHTDRLARNYNDAGDLLNLMSKGLLKEITTPYRAFNSVQDYLYMGFDFVFATHYSAQLGVKVKEGIDSKVLKGEYPTHAPLGYYNKEGKIYIDETKAPYIRRLFELYSHNQYSIKEIGNILYKEGLRTKGGNKVVTAVLHRALINPIYRGDFMWNGKLYEGIHEGIISRELFEAVQGVLEGKNRAKNNTFNFLYRGYLTCDVCGCKLTATKKKQKYDYYYCTNGKNLCTQHKDYMDSDDIKGLISNNFANFIVNKEMCDLSLEQYKVDVRKNNNYQDNTRNLLQNQLAKIEEKLDKLVDMNLEGLLTKEKYTEKQNKLLTEKGLIQEQLKKLPNQITENTLELLEKFKERCYHLQNLFDEGNEEVKSDLLKSALWNLSIKDKEIASAQYKLPYQELANASKSNDIVTWRRERDSNPRVTFVTLGFRDQPVITTSVSLHT